MALKLGSSVSNPASILWDSPAQTFPSSRSSNWFPPPSLSQGISVCCPRRNQINTAICFRKLSAGSNARRTFLKVPRSSGSSSSEGIPEDSKSSDQEKVPFGYTRKDVLLIGLGVTVLGVGLRYGLEKRLDSLTEAELEALLEQVEEEKKTHA